MPLTRKVFTLGSCAEIDNTDVHACDSEKELLLAFRDFFMEADPHVLTGYNITGFDLPFLIQRAEILGDEDFATFSQIKLRRVQINKNDKRVTKIAGRYIHDCYHCVLEYAKKNSNYTGSKKLDSAAKFFLNEGKE